MYESFLKRILYENYSLIFLSYCFTGASRQLLFLEYFLYSFCLLSSRSSFGGAQHYRDTWYFYHTVRLSTIYVYEIAYKCLVGFSYYENYIDYTFLILVHWPKHINFSDPESEGLSGTINFYLETSPKVKVGVWHILPKSLVIGSEGKDK